MEKLNELVELAKELNGESWGYRRTTPYSRGYITGKDGRTIVQTSSGEVPANVCRFIETADPETILAIAEAFRALEQRAEAAEHERDCHMDITEHFKARCKELEQQKPYGYVHNLVNPPGGGVAASIFKEESRHYGRPVFTRPVPAINLAELVPMKKSSEGLARYESDDAINLAKIEGFNSCVEIIMRNIEQQK